MNKKSLLILTLSSCMVLAGCGETAPVLTDIEIAHLPNKTEYILNEQLDLTGLDVKAVYSNSELKDVPAEEYTVSDVDMLTEGEKEVVVTYQEKTASFTVLVTKRHESYSDKSVIGEQDLDDKFPWIPGATVETLKPAVFDEVEFNTEQVVSENIGYAIMKLQNAAGNIAFYSRATERFITDYEFVPNWLEYQLLTANNAGLVGGLLYLKYENKVRVVDTFGNVYLNLNAEKVAALDFLNVSYSVEQARDCLKGYIAIPLQNSQYEVEEHFFKIDMKGVAEEIDLAERLQ